MKARPRSRPFSWHATTRGGHHPWCSDQKLLTKSGEKTFATRSAYRYDIAKGKEGRVGGRAHCTIDRKSQF